jgi:hypothetical protein
MHRISRYVLQEISMPADFVMNQVILQLLIMKFSESVLKNKVSVYRFLNKNFIFNQLQEKITLIRKQVGN